MGFGSVLFLCWVLFIVIGSIISGLATAGPKHIDAFCKGQSFDSKLEWLTEPIKEIDGNLNNQTNHYMCSQVCPCPQAAVAPWLNMTEEEMNLFERTLTPPAGPDM